eukprot:7670541-Ditylum_brightwellii.AAC.1
MVQSDANIKHNNGDEHKHPNNITNNDQTIKASKHTWKRRKGNWSLEVEIHGYNAKERTNNRKGTYTNSYSKHMRINFGAGDVWEFPSAQTNFHVEHTAQHMRCNSGT